MRPWEKHLACLLGGALAYLLIFVVACARTPVVRSPPTPNSGPTSETSDAPPSDLPPEGPATTPTSTAPEQPASESALEEQARPVRFAQAEARALSIQHITDRSRGGTWPTSMRPIGSCEHFCGHLEESFGCVRRMSYDPAASCPYWRCPFAFHDPDSPAPWSVFVVEINEASVAASPSVEACLEKEHGCAIKVTRKAAAKKLRAAREALDMEWSEAEGEFFWVNTDNDKRLSCHG